MGQKRSRAVLVGLSAAAGAFAAAAMMSAATAPTARADAYSDIIADIQAEEADANTAFANASTDFANNDEAAGLTQLYIGVDDDLLGVPADLHVGLVDALTNAPVIPASDFNFSDLYKSPSFATPASDAASVTEAQTFYTEGVTLATAITQLPTTDYGLIALDNAVSSFDQWVLPDQIETIAGLAYGFAGL
jgi:hypothetical protein